MDALKKHYLFDKGQKKGIRLRKFILAAGGHFIHACVRLRNEPQIHCDVILGQNFEGNVNLGLRIMEIEHSKEGFMLTTSGAGLGSRVRIKAVSSRSSRIWTQLYITV